MTLAEFDARVRHADATRQQGQRLLIDADAYERETRLAAGIFEVVSYHGSTMGWRHKDLHGVFSSPREALAAALGRDQ